MSDSNNIVSKYSTTIVSIFQNVINTYETNEKIIKQTEDEINDLNHEIELSTPKDMYKGYLLYKAIRDARIKRRKAKDENQLLKEMYDYFTNQPAQIFKNKMQQIQGSSVKIYDAQQKRTYTPRQRNDLTITDKTYAANKPFEDLLAEFNKKNKVYTEGGKLRK